MLRESEAAAPTCGTMHDRDLNAAKSLEKGAASSAVSAYGEDGAGLRRSLKVKPASVKQEPNTGCLGGCAAK